MLAFTAGKIPAGAFSVTGWVVHGFDAAREAIDELNGRRSESSRRHYHWCAIGDEDGEREFYVTPRDLTQSSFFRPTDSRLAEGRLAYESRRVPVRSLDSLLAAGAIPAPDFLKVDVEGFEQYVLLGAKRCMSQQLIGLETETNFNASPYYPNTHVGALQDCVVPHGFTMFDLEFERIVRTTFQKARAARGLPVLADGRMGRPATFNVLFCRDLVAEADGIQFDVPQRTPRNVDEIIKAMIVYELHGLNDVAFDTACKFADELAKRLDVAKACALLLESGGEEVGPWLSPRELHRRLDDVLTSTSWRITAPLRWLRKRWAG